MRRILTIGATLCTALLTSCSSPSVDGNAGSPPNACTLVSDADIQSAFPRGTSQPAQPMVSDAITSTCSMHIHWRSGDATLVISAVRNGTATLTAACTGSTLALAKIGDAACWNPAIPSVSATVHGFFYSVSVLDSVFAGEYVTPLTDLMTIVIKRQ